MTTDPFTAAARAEAEKRHQGDWDPFEQEPVDDWGFAEAERRAFVTGAEWARTHLAAQEPTAAQVQAAKAEALREAASFWGENPDDVDDETPADARNWLRSRAAEYETGDRA